MSHRRRQSSGRIFALRKAHRPATKRSFNYDDIYEEDQYGEEAFPEARVWKVYSDETQIYDQERIDAWRDALDVLLVFIGLFSAIVTTFVIQTSQNLQPNYAQMTAIITFEILRALANSSEPKAFPSDIVDPRLGEAQPSRGDTLVNALWFTSLAISLSTALLTVLTKQWLYHYTTSTSGTSRERARIRQFRFAGLEAYKVPLIIDLLPILLHISLALFLAGLALFLDPLDTPVSRVVIAITGTSYLLYILSIFLPLFDAQCPYKSPLSFYVYRIHKYLLATPSVVVSAFKLLGTKALSLDSGQLSSSLRHWWRHLLRQCRGLTKRASQHNPTPDHHPSFTLGSAETHSVHLHGAQLDVDAIVWLYTTSVNSAVRSIAMEAFGGISSVHVEVKEVHRILESDLFPLVLQCSIPDFKDRLVPLPRMEHRHDRLLRALCVGSGDHNMDFAPPIKLALPKTAFPEQDDPQSVFAQWILPMLQPHLKHFSFAALFLGCANLSLPVSVWATIIRLAMRRQPGDPLISTLLIANVHLPEDAAEVGAVPLKTAMQNPDIRSLALEYLDMPTLLSEAGPGRENTLSLFLFSLSSILAKENEQDLMKIARDYHSISRPASHTSMPFLLSTLLPRLLRSLTIRLRNASLSLDDDSKVFLKNMFNDLYDSPYVDWLSGETLFCATQAWSTLSYHSLVTLTTLAMIRSMLRQFQRRPYPNGPDGEEELQDCRDTVDNLSWILYWCLDLSDSAGDNGLAEGICSIMRERDMIPSYDYNNTDTGNVEARKPSCIQLFWSPKMCGRIIGRTKKLAGGSPGIESKDVWLGDWLAYIHAYERLVFLCKCMLPTKGWDTERLYDLCRIQPDDPGWVRCMDLLVGLFDDAHFLDYMGGKEYLSVRLAKMKEILLPYQPDFNESYPAV